MIVVTSFLFPFRDKKYSGDRFNTPKNLIIDDK
jgi:hypothetical protein